MKKKMMLLSAIIATAAYGADTTVQTADVQLDKSVVYSTTGFATDMREVAATPTVITSEQIKEKNYKNIADMLEDVPAVSVNKDGFGAIVDMRGQGSFLAKRNVQILIDGVAVNSLDTSMTSTPINTVPISSVERLEIIPGGGSVLYGSGTQGGVINIITKEGKGTRGTVGYQRSSYEGNKYDVQAGHTIGDFDVDVLYNKMDTYGYRDREKDNTEFVQGKVKYRINENQDIEFKATSYDDDAYETGSLNKKQMDKDRRQADGISRIKTEKDDYVITYNAKLRDDLELNVVGFHQKTNMTLSSPENELDVPSKFDDKKIGIKPKLKYSYGEGEHAGSSVVFGVDYIDNKAARRATRVMKGIDVSKKFGPGATMDMVSKTKNDFEKETFGAFVMNNLKWNKFEFNQGIRYERAKYNVQRNSSQDIVFHTMGGDIEPPIPAKTINKDKTENNFAAELSAAYLYSDAGKVYTRVEQGFTSPPPALLSNRTPEKGYTLNDLTSETYTSLEFGWSDYLFDNTAINASAFYTLTKDEMYTEMGMKMGTDMTIYNYNIDKTERYGAEVSLSHYFGKLTLSESYNYTKAKIKKGTNPVSDIKLDGRNMPGVPTHKFKVGAKYDFTENFNVNGEVVYTGKSYIREDNKGGKTDSHTVLNLRAGYELENGVELYAGINNVTNEKYNDSESYSTKYKTYSYSPAAERNYYAGFRYTF